MKTTTKLKRVLLCFILLLVISGLTAFPVRTEIDFLIKHIGSFPPALQEWIKHLKSSIDATPDVILYGTDWLAFAHIVIAMFFIPVYLDPVKYKLNVIVGMIACLGVFPLAFICGPIRGIPFFHQLIDCSFGLGGIALLFWVYTLINQIERKKLNW
ncbi:MAG: hypothetical protein H0W61_13305 [Bacteroidetes bacterium]|nr:hypothetical protein [Bacteroidota bacterium]